MQIIFKELGSVPEHWLWTYVDEIFDSLPFESNDLLPSKQVEDFLKEAAKYYDRKIIVNILEKLRQDARLKLATQNIGIEVHPDGWIKKDCLLKFKHENEKARSILLECTSNWPINKIFILKITTPEGETKSFKVESQGSFFLNLEIPEFEKKGYKIWKIKSSQCFVPAKFNKNTKDFRKLSIKINSLKITFFTN